MTDLIWQMTVPGATGTAYSLTRCGPNMLAFATAPGANMNYNLVATANQLFFINTSDVPATGNLQLTVNTNSAYAGGQLVNVFTVLNNGPYNATGVVFTNALAANSTFVSATSTQGSCTETNGVVTCNIGTMTGGSSVTITVKSSVPYPGSVPLEASVSENEPDLYPSDENISSFEIIYPLPSVTVSNPGVYRRSGIVADFDVVLAAPNPVPISLYGYTTNGSAVSFVDYVPVSETVTIPAGATNAIVPVTIDNSGLVNSNLTFYLNASLDSSAPPIATGSCTLINDNFYGFSVTNTVVPVTPGQTTNATFFVTLSGVNAMSGSVEYFTRDGTAVSGKDYLGKAGTLSFPPGVTSESLSIPVFGDADATPAKTFYLILADPANAVLNRPQATATILKLVIGSGRLLSDGQFQITLNGGVPGQSYSLLASTNLVNWVPINAFLYTNSPVIISDPNATNYLHRFYRIGPP